MADDDDSVSRLRRMVGVDPIDEGSARAPTFARNVAGGGLFGGQVIAQCVSACAHTVPAGAVPDSIEVNLLGTGRSGDDLEFRIERIRDGRALQHRDVRAYQGDTLIARATVTSTVPVEGPDWQSVPMPEVGEPDLADTASQSWAGGLARSLFDVVPPAPAADGARSSHPLWLRLAFEPPENAWFRAAVLSFWSDFGPGANARATHEAEVGPISTLSATHSVWFHRPARLAHWHLFDVHTESLAGNQGFVRARLFEDSGALVASIAQRVFLRRSAAVQES
jgi:acyl-CoA thioesterase II